MDENSFKNLELPDRLPPQNIEAEQCLLGSLMLDKDAIIKIADLLTPRDFYKGIHQKIFQAILDLFKRGEPIDLISVSNRLKEKNELEDIGGRGYLTSLINSVPTASNVLNYAEIVQRKRILRDLIQVGQEIGLMGYKETEDVDMLLDEAEKKVFSIAQGSLSQAFIPIKATLEEAFERIDKLSKHGQNLRGLPTGFRDLDNILAGLQKSDLIILASRPSFGKSSLSLDIARHIAIKEKVPVGIFSLEMSKDQIVDRLIASYANIDLWRLRTGHLSAEGENNDFNRINQAIGVLSEAPIFIDDAASCNVLQMRAMARRLLSRAVEQRTPPTPRLSDLRESGALEQDADVVLFIHRPDRYREDAEKNIAEILIAKHRNGPIGMVKLYFDEQRVCFRTIEKYEQEAQAQEE